VAQGMQPRATAVSWPKSQNDGRSSTNDQGDNRWIADVCFRQPPRWAWVR
jgi:hypothetical protein